MTKFYCLPKPDSKQVMFNLDNLLYCEDYKDLDTYGNRTVMKLVFIGGIEIILEGRPYEVHKRLEELNNYQQQK